MSRLDRPRALHREAATRERGEEWLEVEDQVATDEIRPDETVAFDVLDGCAINIRRVHPLRRSLEA